MSLITGALVLVFGGLTLWLADEFFIKIKPTILYTMFAAILIGGRLPGKLVDALVERLNASMAGRKLPTIAPVRRAEAADDASAIGAAIIPFLDHVLPSESILMQAGR